MTGRWGAVLTFGLILFIITEFARALALHLGSDAKLIWWVAAAAITTTSPFLARRAPTPKMAWGRLLLLDGIFTLALVPTSMQAQSWVMQEGYNPEIVNDAAVRYALQVALSGYFPIIALVFAVALIGASLLLTRTRGSQPAAN